jgi:signal peptidase I
VRWNAIVTRSRRRSALATVALLAVAVPAWLYFAPTKIGGDTGYVVTSGVSMEPRFHTGDLAIIRPASSYRVGEVVAYDSTLLHTVVLHRIIAIHGNRYVFKGDNNNFIDPVNPTRSELLGKLWIHIPHGGILLKSLHNPIVAAIIAALFATVGVFGFGERKRRRRRRERGDTGSRRTGIPLVNRPRHDDGRQPVNYGALLAASALAVAAFAVVAVFAFVRPATKPSARVIPYTQRVSFGYSAHVRPGPVYPGGTIKTGDAIFLSMVRRLNLHIDYRLAGAATNVTGSERVVLTMSGPSGWSRDFVLTPRTRFVGPHTSTDVTLNLSQLQGLLAKIAGLTDSPAFGTFSVAVGPQVQIAGFLAGQRVASSFQPALSFSFASGQLLVSSHASGSQSTEAASSGPSQTNFSPSQTGSVSTPTTAPNTITVFGVSPAISLLRWIALAGLLLSLAATIYFYLRKRSEPFEESFKIMAQYGHMIVPIVGAEDLGWPPVDVPNIKALVKLAESGQRLILHNRSNGMDTYMVNEEGTVYRYQVRPSNVVWGDWSETTAPAQAAA